MNNSLSEQIDGIVVWSNFPDEQSARGAAHHLVEQQLAACVTLLPAVQSVYRWQNAIEEATEVVLMIKTVRSRYAELEQFLKKLHPYDVPEIVALQMVDGLPAYLEWIRQQATGNKG